MRSPTTTSNLSQLTAGVRDALSDWLADCDLNWRKGQIESRLSALPVELQAVRGLALAELVKIDLVKMWQREMETLLESYLERFPELGSADTVAPDLIVAELEARKLAGKLASGREMTARFPKQIEAVRKLISGSSLRVDGRLRESTGRIQATGGCQRSGDVDWEIRVARCQSDANQGADTPRSPERYASGRGSRRRFVP